MNIRTFAILPIAGAAGLMLALAVPLSASGHVTVSPEAAEPGSYTVITFKVPNESATAATNQVEVQLPTDTPFSSVRYVPVPGWSAELVQTSLPEPVTVGENEITEAVTSVIWTAASGSEISDGQLQQFDLSVGPVPDTGSIVLPALQSYTDGEVVEWNGTTEDAAHPAPILYVNDAPATDHHGGASQEEEEEEEATAVTTEAGAETTSAGSTDDVLARVLGVGGLVVGAVGIVLALTSRRKVTS